MKRNVIVISLEHTLKYIVLLILISISISYITLLTSMTIKYAIDGVLLNNYIDIPEYVKRFLQDNYMVNLLSIAVLIILLNFIFMLLNYFRNRITTKLELRIKTNLKCTLYNHMINLEYKSYNSYDKAEIMQRINEDAEVFSSFFNSEFNVILDILFLGIFIVKESATLNLPISVYILITILAMVSFSIWYLKKLNISIGKMIDKRKKLLNSTIINVSNSKLVRMFNKQKEEKEKYKQLNDDYTNENIKFIKLVLFYDIISEHITYLKNPIIYLIGGMSIIKRNYDYGLIDSIIQFSRENI